MTLLEVLAVMLFGTAALVVLAGLVGFMAIAGAMYLTHRPLDLGLDRPAKGLAAVLPPPVAVDTPASEIVLHPAVMDYINGESEQWYRNDLKEKAKTLYRQHPVWEWVLAELRKLNEQQVISLPDDEAFPAANPKVSDTIG